MENVKLWVIVEALGPTQNRILDGALAYDAAVRKAQSYIDRGHQGISVWTASTGAQVWPEEVTP